MTLLAHTRLLQMASQAFPIGGYSHSQGLESAIESGWVTDEATVAQWINDVLLYSLMSYEVPWLDRVGSAWRAADGDMLRLLNAQFLATRESAELRRATVQMGYSLRALLDVLPNLSALSRVLHEIDEPSLPCVWGGLSTAWSIAPRDSLLAYLWVWAENQVLVALKSVPIGQSSGQRILLLVGEKIAALAEAWNPADAAALSNFAPGLAILSAQHETQYSRLFRS